MLLILENYLDIEQLSLTYIQTSLTKWWSDTTLGSALWTLVNKPMGDDFLAEFDKVVLDSLKPLIVDGLAKSIEIVSEISGKSRVNYELTIIRPDGTSEVIIASWGI